MSDRVSIAILVCGVVIGAGVAVTQIVVTPDSAGLSEKMVARVNGQPIYKRDLERALRAVATDRRQGVLAASDRTRILDRLIDQELLIQSGVDLGLHMKDSRVRNDIATAMIEFVAARGESEDVPSDEVLEAFWAENQVLFQQPARYRIEHAFFKGTTAESRNRAEQARLRSPLEGDPYWLSPDDAPLPLKSIRQRLGASAATALASLEIGQTSEPIETDSGYHVVRLVERTGGAVYPYEDVQEEVRSAYERQAGERALRRFLEEERRRSQVELSNVP